MTSTTDPLRRWRELQRELVGAAASQTEDCFRAQAHDDLSPIGWHLEHCVFVECVWIRSALLDDHGIRDRLAHRCLPELAPKSGRGSRLPPRSELLQWSSETMRHNDTLLREIRDPNAADPLRKGDRILHFLVSHHAQHLETMRTIALRFGDSEGGKAPARAGGKAGATDASVQRVAAGFACVGSADAVRAHDNELPRSRVRVQEFRISERPVTNRAWEEFVAAGGYQDPRWWTPDGWRWRRHAGVEAPEAWRYAAAAAPDDFVSGVSRHEAGAYARFQRGRLPHEHEWETARMAGLLRDTGRVWEWCANRFHPYPGFRPFPYREYSLPWFDGRHYVLKGGSRLSEPEVRRATFRNYYTPTTRHILSGVRVAYDCSV